MKPTIKGIFKEYADEYLQANAGMVPTNHKKVIDAIINCRTEAYGMTFYKCESCGKIHSSYRSCGNRHCPVCQNHKTKQWVFKQLQKELSCNYFMITFTVPQEIREFFLPIFQLSKLCRGKFKEIMKNMNLLDAIPSVVWDKEWNVNIQAVGSGRNTIKYLSRYVFKIAITDHRIIKVQNRRVYFKYKNRETSKVVVTSLDVLDFIKKYLLHVLPSGFMKVRYYGFMHPSCSIDYDELRVVVEGLISVLNKPVREIPEKVTLLCSECGKAMKFMFSILPNNARILGTGFS